MPWLIDGSNVLGGERYADDAKRRLVRLLASFARAKRTRVTCVFDGPEPPSFARHLGAVSVVFGGTRSADDVIAERAANGRGWSVVTSDRGLAARVQRRQVTVVAPRAFLRDIELTATTEDAGEEDWLAYFSDPKNREKF
ncbi:MAG: NYN domain-containing protein [Acidobacteria bacterium]|nr:NYN domain-containing protein [Acidobacteriota bacterium]MBV9474540.1 NYN domain-containing protein [Acidobacteriota bacterium]